MNWFLLLGWVFLALGLQLLVPLVTAHGRAAGGPWQHPFVRGVQGIILILIGARYAFPQWVPVPYQAPFCRPQWLLGIGQWILILLPSLLALMALLVEQRTRDRAFVPPPPTSKQRRATIIGLLVAIGGLSFVFFVWQPWLGFWRDTVELEHVRLTAPGEGWAIARIGFRGAQIYRLQQNRWAPATDELDVWFTDIDLLDTTTGWATTFDHRVFRLVNGVWTAEPAPADVLSAVAAVTADEAWAAGDGAFFHWRNNAWTAVPLPRAHLINDLVMLRPDTGWAVGGSVYDEQSGVMLQYVNSGWREVAIPTELPLLSISMLPDGTGWAVGGTQREPVQQVVLHYDGAAWREIPSPTMLPLKQVVALGPEQFWAIAGGSFSVPLNCAQRVTTAAMHTIVVYDAGTWRELSAPVRYLNGIAALPGDEVRLAADDRILRYTANWWQTWQVEQRFTE